MILWEPRVWAVTPGNFVFREVFCSGLLSEVPVETFDAAAKSNRIMNRIVITSTKAKAVTKAAFRAKPRSPIILWRFKYSDTNFWERHKHIVKS